MSTGQPVRVQIRGVRDRAPIAPRGFVVTTVPHSGKLQFEPRENFTSPREAANNAAQVVSNPSNLPLAVPANQMGAAPGVVEPDGTTIAENGSGVISHQARPTYTYATLPASPSAGWEAFVTDSNTAASGNFGATLAGSGTNKVPVYYDGTNWRIG